MGRKGLNFSQSHTRSSCSWPWCPHDSNPVCTLCPPSVDFSNPSRYLGLWAWGINSCVTLFLLMCLHPLTLTSCHSLLWIKYLCVPSCSPSTSPDQDILMLSCSRICVCSHLHLFLDAFVSSLPHFPMSLSQRLFNCIWVAYQSASCLLPLLSLLVHSIFPPPAAGGRQEAFLGIQALTSQTVSRD